MNRRTFVRNALIFSASVGAFGQAQGDNYDVLKNGQLATDFNMGVDDNKHLRSWLNIPDDKKDYIELDYPAGLNWGAVFITYGDPGERSFLDMSTYKSLVVEMRGGLGGEIVQIGIKANDQKDNGAETKIKKGLTNEWAEYQFPLSQFRRANATRLWVVAEFVFSDKAAQTVLVRNVKYSKHDS